MIYLGHCAQIAKTTNKLGQSYAKLRLSLGELARFTKQIRLSSTSNKRSISSSIYKKLSLSSIYKKIEDVYNLLCFNFKLCKLDLNTLVYIWNYIWTDPGWLGGWLGGKELIIRLAQSSWGWSWNWAWQYNK